MDMTLWIVGVVLALSVIGFFAYNYYKKKNLEKLFNQIYAEMKVVPKQKKHGFLLLMFKETMQNASKKKKDPSNNMMGKLQNPKFLEVQLVQMNNIIKNPSKAEDKVTKKALALYNSYLVWEKAKSSK